MITRSLVRRLTPDENGDRRGPVAGPTHKDAFPCFGTARRPDPSHQRLACEPEARRAQVARATQSNNYWSATTYAPNPQNAWIANFNNGNVNANNRTNNNYLRVVRSGS